MSIQSKLAEVAVKGGLNVAGRSLSGSISAAGSIVGGALSGMGSAIGGALQGIFTEPDVIINSMGTIGEVSKKKVTGGVVTLPALKKNAKPIVNKNAPSEELISVAIKYLSNVAGTLEAQYEMERTKFQRDKLAERENAIESTKDAVKVEDNKKKNKTKKPKKKDTFAKSIIKDIMKFGAFGAALGMLDSAKEFSGVVEETGKELDKFQKKYGFLINLTTSIGTAAWLGSFFGPTGLFVGAAAGVTYAIASNRQDARKSHIDLFSGEDRSKAIEYYKIRDKSSGVAGTLTPSSSADEDRKNKLRGDLSKSLSSRGYSKSQIDDYFRSLDNNDVLSIGEPNTDATKVTDPNNVAEYVHKYFKRYFTNEQAAGIVANLYHESKLNPHAVGDNGNAYGIAQWHPDRQAKFEKVFKKNIRDSSLQEQLDFIIWELNNTEKSAKNSLLSSSSASESAKIFDSKYERSAGYNTADRMAAAESITKGQYSDFPQGRGMFGDMAESASNGYKMLTDFIKENLSTDTTYVPLLKHSEKYDKSKEIMDKQIANESHLIYGDKQKNSNATSELNAPLDDVINLNGGSLDVINPNYMMNDYNILSSYLNFFIPKENSLWKTI